MINHVNTFNFALVPLFTLPYLNVCVKQYILYTAKLLSGKIFAVFAVFQPIVKVFPLESLAVYST